MKNRLNEIKQKRDRAFYNTEPLDVPEYTVDGQVFGVKKKTKSLKAAWIVLGIVVAISVILYLPALWGASDGETQVSAQVKGDKLIIQKSSEWTQNNPSEDFDGDGLVNSLERQYETSPRRIDTDNDGISDYAEIYLTKTSPTTENRDVFIEYVKKMTENAGASMSSPYKTYNVVMWPNSWASRAYGAVIPTKKGYQFCHFTGWAQFPDDGYAYIVSDGAHMLLSYRETENAWYIPQDCEVVFYPNKLDTFKLLKTPFGESYIETSFFSNILDAILLDDSAWFTCKEVVNIDAWTEPDASILLPLASFSPITLPDTRLGVSHNTLEQLAACYASIDNGKYVVSTLYSSEIGETVVVVYGYDSQGSLFVSDMNGNHLGTLTISIRGTKYLDHEGMHIQSEWYEFVGLGFNSFRYDRIAFIATVNATE